MKTKGRLSTIQKEILLVLFMLLMAAVRQFLVYNLPIMAVPKGVHDDWIMVHQADTLLSGQWLGEYNSLTLTKGMFFPLYLAVINKLGLSYLNVTAVLYAAACIFFVYALCPLIQKYWARFVLYTALLWNPVSFSLQAFQRVYRNSITYIQVLFIFGGFLAVYLRRKYPAKKHIIWMIGAVGGLTSFYYTREDAIWVLPFLAVFLAVYIGSLVYDLVQGIRHISENGDTAAVKLPGNDKETDDKKLRLLRPYLAKLVLVLLPFLSVWAAGQFISAQNYSHYGIYTTNDLNSGGFAAMYKSMMSVKPEEEIDGVTITNEKIARMCEVCPTLAELEPYIESSKEYWAGEEGDAEGWEVEDGWVFWIIRTALEQAGYYSDAETADAICYQIRDEIEAALDAGLLERQATMPSTYMSPWREGYFGELINALGKAIGYTVTYDEVETLVYLYSEPDEDGGIVLFEEITGDRAVWYESDLIEFEGWYVSYDGMEGVSLAAELSDGTVLGEAQFEESADVSAYLEGEGIYADGSESCRFHFDIYVEDKPQDVYLRAYRDGELIDEYLLSDELDRVEGESSCLNIDWYWDVPERHGLLADINYKGIILNGIRDIYSATGPFVAVLAALAYVYLCISMLKEWLSERKREAGRTSDDAGICKRTDKAENDGPGRLAIFLVLTAILFSYMVLLGGISYSEISGWDAILYWYLSGAYPLMIAFEILAPVFAFQRIKESMVIYGKTVSSGNKGKDRRDS